MQFPEITEKSLSNSGVSELSGWKSVFKAELNDVDHSKFSIINS